MTKEQYERWSAPFRKNAIRIKILKEIDKWITGAVFLAYPALLAYLFLQGNFRQMCFSIGIPGGSFLAVSLFRSIYSAPRPYEVLEITPLILKETKGKSFPSRHVFSAFIIGMTFLPVLKPIGILILAAGTVMAFIRVIGGVHFPKDTAAGALFGILCGMLYVFL